MTRDEALRLLRAGRSAIREWNSRRRRGEAIPDLREAKLRDANLRGINLRNAKMWVADLQSADLREADLRGADLTHAFVLDARLAKANLFRCGFGGADLRGSDVRHADVRNADLRGADLREADFAHSNLAGALLGGAQLAKTRLSDAELRGANLEGASLVETNLQRADLSGCYVYGISAWRLKLQGANQSDLIISRGGEPAITVDNLEVAQFIYLLLHNKRIRDVIDTITSKVVLVLGRFKPERKRVLDAVRDELRRRGYCPVLFDFARPTSRDFVETVGTLAHMARFIVADFTDAKIVLEEVPHIVRNLAVPIVPLLHGQREREPVTLFNLRRNHRSLLSTYRYRSLRSLVDSLAARVIRPAERAAEELQLAAPRTRSGKGV